LEPDSFAKSAPYNLRVAKKKMVNPFCSVVGCTTDKPHTADFLVKALVDRFAAPDKCLSWVLAGMAELRDSVTDDVLKNRLFSWYTRMRQPEELYFRTLYILFLASDDEVPHILSGDPPNSFSQIYKAVNGAILEGRGEMTEVKPGLVSGEFRMIDNLNDGAHVGFGAMQMIVNIAQNPERGPDLAAYLKHIETYCVRINYMRQMFEGGKPKDVVREAVTNLHRPKEYWEQKAKEKQTAAQATAADPPA
jgi:hypothetical protein